MALPGHSPPPPYSGPGSPGRGINGYPETQPPFSSCGPTPRTMLPPSPQHYHNRYPPNPPPSSAANSHSDNRFPLPPQKRPGSSMSISSMLGAEPDRPLADQYAVHNSRTPSRQASISGPPMSLGAVMSPPQFPSKPSLGEYSYKPRSQTPDRVSGASFGTRTHRSSSGTMMQRPGPFYDPPTHPASKPPAPRYNEPPSAQPFDSALLAQDDRDESRRRTSISGILQRPESEPRAAAANGYSGPNVHQIGRAESAAPALQNGDRYGHVHQNEASEHARPTALPGSYDTRPPGITNTPRQPVPPNAPKEFQGLERPTSLSQSPELRRQQADGPEYRGLAGILNQISEAVPGAYNMARQDSIQSQSERSAFGERYRARPYSPFAGSVASQNMSHTSAPADDSGRKGSDELSQHRAILGLAAESKRGRYSPLPQAVQGAQAQTPVPDAGIKSEHGRVFAGLGTGMGTSSAGPTPTLGPLAASPFRQNEGSRLSEENLMKMSRSASGISKRPRKLMDDDPRAESEAGDGKKGVTGRGGKKSKYSHYYKLELEESAQRRSTAMAGVNSIRRPSSPTNGSPALHHHHQLHRQTSTTEHAPVLKPKKTIRISAILANAKRLPRRHIGSFTYTPEIGSAIPSKPALEKFNVSVRPNLLPSFNDSELVNCIYSVRVPKLWLHRRERGLICKEACLWGSGVYSDDSDVVAAAMHAGFIQAVAPEGIDQVLLERVVHEQNAKIDGLTNVPEKPVEPEEGKDAIITLVVMPALERYTGSARFGISSRNWPEDETKTPHDGVSFTIAKVEYVAGGVEARRMGRTGKDKRARIQQELEERKRAELLQKKMIQARRTKLKEKMGTRLANATSTSNLTNVTSSGTLDSARPAERKAAALPLNVGQAPGDWLRQAEAVAAV